MTDALKILMVSAEVAPFAKVGGLGDVAGSLPKALRAMGHDVRVVMTAYAKIERGYAGAQITDHRLNVPVRREILPAGVYAGTLPDSDVPIYFIAERNLFDRDNIYGYEDDAYRFAFFSRAVFELMGALDWVPDVLHAHDWHTAASVLWLKTGGQGDARFRDMSAIYTIHNLAHQGKVSWDLIDYLDIQTHRLVEEPHGTINLMARGIFHANAVTTVSPTYGREIMGSAEGAGLDAILRHRHNSLYGILNGLDYDVWNPATDLRIPDHYSADSIDDRLRVRHALQDAVGLPRRDDVPLIAMISRLDWQKGLDLFGEVAHRLMNDWAGEAQLIVLGSGQPEYEDMLRNMAAYHSDKMRAVLEYNAALAPLIYGGSDMFLMPSLFEPCGLSQLISMRYGSIPVVRATGGLVDTVFDGRTGFVFNDFSVEAFWEGLARAIYVYNVDKPRWWWMQRMAMQSDFSWERSAGEYVDLYRSTLNY